MSDPYGQNTPFSHCYLPYLAEIGLTVSYRAVLKFDFRVLGAGTPTDLFFPSFVLFAFFVFCFYPNPGLSVNAIQLWGITHGC